MIGQNVPDWVEGPPPAPATPRGVNWQGFPDWVERHQYRLFWAAFWAHAALPWLFVD